MVNGFSYITQVFSELKNSALNTKKFINNLIFFIGFSYCILKYNM